ncbi:hypothetical protein RJ640_010907, partial [Escallonia rubra]
IKLKNVTRLCQTKSILTVNGKFPGPRIVAREGDTVLVKVANHVKNNVTLHWHGVRQLRSGWADGPAYITQCPIQTGQTYVYNFTITGQRGTLFWHAHISWLRATLYGPIVILPKRGVPYPFPSPNEEVPIIFGEWWKADTETIINQALQNGGAPNISDAFTINGLPGPLYNCSAKGAAGKIQGLATRASGSFAPSEPAAPSPMQFSSTYGHHGKGTVGNALEHEGGISNSLAIGDKTIQDGIRNNVTEMPILRSAAPRDTGKSPLSPAPTPHGMPFKEQHLKQLRAQCLVFLAFRDVIDQKGNEQSVDDPSSTSEVATPFGKLENAMETERTPPGSSHTGTSAEVNMLTEAENNMTEGINFLPSGLSGHAEERKHLLAPRRKPEDEVQIKGAQSDAFSVRDLASTRQNANLESRHRQVGMTNQASSVMVASQQIKPEVIGWSGNGSRYEAPKVSLPTSALPPEPVPAPERKDITRSQSQNGGDVDDSEGNRHADCYLPGFASRDHSRPLLGTVGGHELANPVKDADIVAKSASQGENYTSRPTI